MGFERVREILAAAKAAEDAARLALPATDPPQTLFRAEAVAARQSQSLGAVLLEPRLSGRLLTWASMTAALAVLAFLLLGSYTRKAHVNGWLVPQQGLARIFAPQGGIITRVHAREGEWVKKGASLVTLSGEIQSTSGGATQELVIQQLNARRSSQLETKKSVQRQLDEQHNDLAKRASLARARLQLGEQSVARERALRARDLITMPRLQRTEQEVLDQKSALTALEGALRELPFRRETQLAEIDRSVTAIEQEIAQTEARREIVVTAPQDGTVTSIQADPGSNVQSTVPLLSVVPDGTVLEAHLFAASRAVGFVRPGQRVLLRYQAYPYQKYGSYAGRVTSVSKAAINPAELSQQVTGLSSLVGANEPFTDYRCARSAVCDDLRQADAVAAGNAARRGRFGRDTFVD